MSNTVSNTLPINACESFRDLFAILEVLLVDESVQLCLLIPVLHLAEHQLDRLEVIPIGHVPDGLHGPFFHHTLDLLRLVNLEIVQEDVDRHVTILPM